MKPERKESDICIFVSIGLIRVYLMPYLFGFTTQLLSNLNIHFVCFKTQFIHTYLEFTAKPHNLKTIVTKRQLCCVSTFRKKENSLVRLMLLLSAGDWPKGNRCWQRQTRRTLRKRRRNRETQRQQQKRSEADRERESLAWI